ncbi:MAG: hypothetical protein JRI68_14830, partial [Deltaproteobacteria bacterium]|nr:hypothetical protein [Deltaproteobacteria bacterium]
MLKKLVAVTLPTCFAFSALSGGCNLQTDQSLADDATASVSQTQQAAGLTKLITQPLDNEQPASPEEATETLEAKGIAGLYPADCVTISPTSLKSVHVEFDDCTGPFGLLHLTGGVDAEVSLNQDGQVEMDLADSGDLTVEGNPVDYGAHAVFVTIGVDSELSWQGHWSAETEWGELATHDTNLRIKFNILTRCIQLDGKAESALGERGLDWRIDGYAVCPLECPSGGVVNATGKESGETVTITFDGSGSADVTLPGGDTYDVPLVCA